MRRKASDLRKRADAITGTSEDDMRRVNSLLWKAQAIEDQATNLVSRAEIPLDITIRPIINLL